MALDFSGAPQNQGGELIPDNSLAFGTLTIRPKNAEFSKILHSGKTNPDNKYLDCEIDLTTGPSAGRKVFHMIGVKGSEKWVNMGMAAIRHILEVGKLAGPENPQGYTLGANMADDDERMWMELDGLQCAIKVGIEPGGDGYKDKNRVKAFLSPNPGSPTVKDFTALAGGATEAEGGRRSSGGGNKPAASAPWAGGATSNNPPFPTNATPQATNTPAARPAWAGTPPSKA